MSRTQVVIGGALALVAVVLFVAVLDFHHRKESGEVILTGVQRGAFVFIDSKRHGISKGTTHPIVLGRLSIGAHTVVVARDGYWPWSKKLVLANRERTEVKPFLVHQEPRIREITKTHEHYDTLMAFAHSIPTRENPRISNDETTEIFIEEAIIARWIAGNKPPASFCILGTCTSEFIILPADKKIQSLEFFKGRSDVVLFSADNGVFAIELDKRGTQNFQPVYLGTSPIILVSTQEELIIKDGGRLLSIALDEDT